MHPNETVVVLLDAILLEAQSPAVVGGGKAFATEIADRDICILAEKVTAQGVLLGNLRKRQMSPLTSGRPAFQQHAKRSEGSDTTPISHTHVWHTSHNFDRSEKRSRSPAGPRRLRNSDAHKRIAVPKALCVLQERLRPRPKSGKVCRFKPRPRRVSETCGTLRG